MFYFDAVVLVLLLIFVLEVQRDFNLYFDVFHQLLKLLIHFSQVCLYPALSSFLEDPKCSHASASHAPSVVSTCPAGAALCLSVLHWDILFRSSSKSRILSLVVFNLQLNPPLEDLSF